MLVEGTSLAAALLGGTFLGAALADRTFLMANVLGCAFAARKPLALGALEGPALATIQRLGALLALRLLIAR